MSIPQLEPKDQYNLALEQNVRPKDWVNPEPAERYHLVVIGAGTAGLVTAAGAAGLGAKVALVERGLMGGDCLNSGCVPSKGLIRTARAAGEARNAASFGLKGDGQFEVDFGRAMERMRRLRSGISEHDSVKRFKELGVDVFLGEARFADTKTVEVADRRLRFSRAVIATGSRAAVPSIAGLEEVNYLTNETVFSLTEKPERLAVVGAGPIGCELAQTFARFGSRVDLIESFHGVLPREERDAAGVVQGSLERDGIRVLCCGRELTAANAENGGIRLRLDSHGKSYDETFDQVVFAVGRRPNIEGLDLEKAGVEFSKKGVSVNDRLQTANPRIYAAGDVCSPYQFTHAADFMARLVIQNALFWGRNKMSSLVIPWCTYTMPELARVGLSEKEANEKGIPIETVTQDLKEVDRAVLDGTTEGFVRAHVRKGSDRIVGATIVAENAGDMISNLSLAMTHNLGLKKLAGTISPYPTQSEAVRKLGDRFNRSRLTPFVKSLIGRRLKWMR